MQGLMNYRKNRLGQDESYDSMTEEDKLDGLDQSLGYLISSRPDSIPAEKEAYAPGRMNEDRFKPSDYAMKEYETYSRAVPKREDYKPSTGRNILAGAMAGLSAGRGDYAGAMKLGESIRDQKYNMARRDYDERGEGLYKAAKLEDDANSVGIRNQNYTDMHRDRDEDNNRDAYYKNLHHDVEVQRAEDARTRYKGVTDDRERNYQLRERNTNSAIGARNAQLGISRERLNLTKNKDARSNTPKAPTANQNLSAQISAEKLVDQNLASMPEFQHIYVNGKINGEAATNTFHALRRHYIEELLKKSGQGRGSVMPQESVPDEEPDNDEDDGDGFNFN